MGAYYLVQVGSSKDDATFGVNFESYSIQPDIRGKYHHFDLNDSDKGLERLKKDFELIRKGRALKIHVPSAWTNAISQFKWASDKKLTFAAQIDLMRTFDDSKTRPPVVTVIETTDVAFDIARLKIGEATVRGAWATELGGQDVYLTARNVIVQLAY